MGLVTGQRKVSGTGGSQKPPVFLETETGRIQRGSGLGSEMVTDSICLRERKV